jgi:hypothetical protein
MHCTNLISAHLYSYMLDCVPAEPGSEFQEEQSLGEYGGSQATSCVDTTYLWIKASPSALTNAPYLLYLIFALCSIMVMH